MGEKRPPGRLGLAAWRHENSGRTRSKSVTEEGPERKKERDAHGSPMFWVPGLELHDIQVMSSLLQGKSP